MKITKIRTTPLALPFKQQYYWAGRRDLGAIVVLVEVETDEGITGVAESTGTRATESIVGIIQDVAPLFIGESPFDIEGLFARAYHLGGFQCTPRFANLALAGLEMALWDVIGKAAGRPVYQLLGGAARQEIDYFAFLQGNTAQELAEDARQAVEQGYQVIYFKVGRGEEIDLANVAAIRAVIGDRHLRLDANEAWDPLTAIYMINRLARYDIEFVEQPTPSQSIPALRQVKEAVGVPIAADQSVFTLADVYEVCRQQAADVIVLSPHETGGILPFKKAAAVAESAGLAICLHGQFVSCITDIAQHQIGLTIPNLTEGNQIMHQLLVEDTVSSPDMTLKAGKFGLMDGPGLGFTLNRQAIERAAQRYRQIRGEAWQLTN